MPFYRPFAAILCVFCAGNLAAKSFDVAAHYTKFEYRIPMRDGVKLFTAVYVPKDTSSKWPFLVTRTPYSVGPYGPDKYPKQLGPSDKFAEDRFIFVRQDVRGRYMSEGVWLEMTPENAGATGVDESTDTYDTIDWLIKNIPNNNGKVGLLGISYPGFYTSAGMINAHPALVAASPQAPVSDLYMGDDAFHNGAFFLIANFSFYTFFNKQNNPTLPEKDKDFDYGTKDGYEYYMKIGNVANLDNQLHPANPYWNDVVEHPNYDDFWKTRNVLPHLTNIKPAVLVVGGWFDAEDLAGTLKTFKTIEKQSPDTNDKLVMGPWSHGGWERTNGDHLGNVSFGADTSQFFQDEILLPFFRHYLKDAEDPKLPTAYVFETGKNEWRKEKAWPPKGATKRLYFTDRGTLGMKPPKDGDAAFDEYVSDPNNPVPYFEKPTLDMEKTYMAADQRFLRNRPDVLTYETEPLKEDFTIGGPISPSLHVSSTATDSDFIVKLIDVDPTGYEQLVRGEPFRAKFRNSFEMPEPLKPGEPTQIHFDMPDVFHCFPKGHKIMVQVQSSWFPLVDRNPQTFENIPTAKPEDFVKATERIYRSSYVEVNQVK